MLRYRDGTGRDARIEDRSGASVKDVRWSMQAFLRSCSVLLSRCGVCFCFFFQLFLVCFCVDSLYNPIINYSR